MKLLIFFASLLLLVGCQSREVIIDPVVTTGPGSATVTAGGPGATSTTDTSGRTLLARGQFVNNVHSVSGTVRVYERAGKRTLVFTNFRTDGGPDLRIYVAENTSLRNFAEVTKLNSSGNFSVDLPAETDPAKQRYVLIWCKAFSVLFGSAQLM